MPKKPFGLLCDIFTATYSKDLSYKNAIYGSNFYIYCRLVSWDGFGTLSSINNVYCATLEG